jgi:hypothetical protein
VSTWDVADVGVWLAAIGLQQYADAFAESSVDGDLLLDISDRVLHKTIKMSKASHVASFRAGVDALKSARRTGDDGEDDDTRSDDQFDDAKFDQVQFWSLSQVW